jgi:hypothetical protein
VPLIPHSQTSSNRSVLVSEEPATGADSPQEATFKPLQDEEELQRRHMPLEDPLTHNLGFGVQLRRPANIFIRTIDR